MRRTRALVLVAIASASLLAACQLVLGIDGIDGEAAPDAATDAGIDATDASAATDATVAPFLCAFPPSGVPTPPSALYPPQDSGVRGILAFAIESMSGDTVSSFNLDCRDTVSAAAGITDKPCATSPVDEDGGIDNEYVDGVRAVFPSSTDFISQVFDAVSNDGEQTLLLVIQGTGGALDQEGNFPNPSFMTSSVAGLAAVGCTPSYINGFCADGGNTCGPNASGAPRWDGCDLWSSPTNPSDNGSVYTTNLGFASDAYLRSGKVVMRFDKLSIALNAAGLDLEDVTLVAQPSVQTVDAGDGGDAGPSFVVLDGQMAGRVPAENLLAVAARYELDGMPLCALPGLQSEKGRLCALRDLPAFDLAHPDLRGGAPTAACTRVSIVVSFHAVQARILPSGLVVPYVDPCTGGFDASCSP